MPMKTAISIGLRCIPPASRQPGAVRRRTGGLSARLPARVGAEKDGFKLQVVAPNEQVRRQRKAYQQALAAKARQLEELIAQAEEAGGEIEAAHWRGELAKLAQG